MTRLDGWSVVMAIGNQIVGTVLPHPEQQIITNNIFATIFVITIYLTAIELVRSGRLEKSMKKIGIGVGLMLVPIGLSAVLMLMMETGNMLIMKAMLLFVPNLMFVEGGILLVA